MLVKDPKAFAEWQVKVEGNRIHAASVAETGRHNRASEALAAAKDAREKEKFDWERKDRAEYDSPDARQARAEAAARKAEKERVDIEKERTAIDKERREQEYKDNRARGAGDWNLDNDKQAYDKFKTDIKETINKSFARSSDAERGRLETDATKLYGQNSKMSSQDAAEVSDALQKFLKLGTGFKGSVNVTGQGRDYFQADVTDERGVRRSVAIPHDMAARYNVQPPASTRHVLPSNEPGSRGYVDVVTPGGGPTTYDPTRPTTPGNMNPQRSAPAVPAAPPAPTGTPRGPSDQRAATPRPPSPARAAGDRAASDNTDRLVSEAMPYISRTASGSAERDAAVRRAAESIARETGQPVDDIIRRIRANPRF